MKAVVMGTGGWGTALSLVLCDNGHETWLWSRNPEKAVAMAESRENPLLKGVHLKLVKEVNTSQLHVIIQDVLLL